MPGEDKNLSGFLFLCLISAAIAAADVAAGWAISLRPLFVVPIILSSIYLSRNYAYALAFVAAFARIESFRVSILPEGESFPFFLNFCPALVAYVAIAEFGSLATTTIRELLDYIDVLHEELALERIAGMDRQRVADQEEAEA